MELEKSASESGGCLGAGGGALSCSDEAECECGARGALMGGTGAPTGPGDGEGGAPRDTARQATPPPTSGPGTQGMINIRYKQAASKFIYKLKHKKPSYNKIS